MASRKACLLAMLWSCSLAEQVPPETIKQTYKKLTTDFRERGVAQAIASHSPELMGKALVSMLTKFDRPTCNHLAYDLANALLRQSSENNPKRAPRPARPLPEREELEFFSSALKAGKQNVRSLKTKHGESLAAHALRKGRRLAFRILRNISKDVTPPP